MTPEPIAIREIQHFLYCPHRWGLLQMDCVWAENYYIAKANLLHSRVHNPARSYTQRGRKVLTSLPIYCDLPDYPLLGVADCVEAVPCAGDGARLDASDKRYALCLVEYKPTLPRERDFNPDDAMQVFAQKICVDFLFGGDCDAALYYADAKKRVPLPFREQRAQWEAQLRQTLSQMRTFLEENRIPPIPPGQTCAGCSLRDLCMPTLKPRADVRTRIARMMEEAP